MLLGGCGEYEKLLKSRDFKKKYETGVEMYEKEEYVKAATLFDQVSNIYRGTTKADTVKYYQAKIRVKLEKFCRFCLSIIELALKA